MTDIDWLPQYRQLLQDQRVYVFCNTVAHAQQIADTLGPSAVVVHGKTPWKQRAEIYQRFRDGEFRTICGTGAAMEGAPLVATGLMVMRPTASRLMHERMLYYVSNAGKRGIALDFAGNTTRLGIPAWFQGRVYAPPHPLMRTPA